MESLGIDTIKRSKKIDSKIVYITCKDQEAASIIFRRTAQIKNDEVHVTPFIPPQIFERYRSLQYYCKVQRDMNPELKTKVLLGSDDLILRTKLKSEYYWKTNFNLEEYGPLRCIDMNRKWPNLEEERVFSPPNRGQRNIKHFIMPSSPHE